MDTATALIRAPGRPRKMNSQRRFTRTFLGMVLSAGALLSGLVHAQAFNLQPTLQTRMTYSDNIRPSDDDKRSGWLAEVSPGLSGATTGAGRRLDGRFNLVLRNAGYSSELGWQGAAPSFQANGQYEAVEGLFFIAADGAIRRSNLSPFSGRASDDFLERSRRNETRSFSLAPRLAFSLGSHADVNIQYRQQWLSGGRGTLSAQRRGEWTAGLEATPGSGPLYWSVDYERADTSYSRAGLADARQESLQALVGYDLTPQVTIAALTGYEQNNFRGVKNDGVFIGGGVEWRPSMRTRMSARVIDRDYANDYEFVFSHRLARSALQLVLARDLSSSVELFGSVFQDDDFLDLFNSPIYQEEFPDPIEREQAIRERFGFTGGGFVTNAYFLDRRVRASYSLLGVRNTLTFGYTQSDRSRVGDTSGLLDEDLFRDSSRVKNKSLSVLLSHRLSGRSAINTSLVRSVAERSGGLHDRTRRLTASLGYSARLGHRTVGGLTYRHQKSSGASDFTENVISANMNMRF